MTVPDAGPQSFIIKVWLEETLEETGQAIWRGHITHVPTGERRYVQALDDLLSFINPYLEAMGVQTAGRRHAQKRWEQLRSWLSCRFSARLL